MKENIDKGIEIPRAKTGRKRKYPIIERIDLGESTFIKRTTEKNLADLYQKVSNCAQNYKRTVGLDSKFKIRTFISDDGVRVWRTK